MRVIAGTARGVPLKGPPGTGTRPTSDKIRGVIFDVLAAETPEARVLDLYAGTGALGIEALSRGAQSCLFVEKVPVVCRVIEANVQTAKLAEGAFVWCSSVVNALERLVNTDNVPIGSTFRPPYDLIMLDPPYADAEIVDVIERLAGSSLLAANGIIVLEHGKRLMIAGDRGRLQLRRTRTYGDTTVTIWQLAEEESEV